MKRALKISLSFWFFLFCAIALVRSAYVAPGPSAAGNTDAVVVVHPRGDE